MPPRAALPLLPLPRALLLVVLLVLQACASSGDSRPGAAPARIAPIQREPTVTLLSRGSGPARALRFELEPGTVQELTVSVDTGMNMRMEERINGLVLPPWSMDLGATVLEANAEEARTRTVVRRTQLMPREAIEPERMRAFEESIQRLVGLEWESLLTTRGYHRGGSFALPEGADESFRQLGEVTGGPVLLPSEPIAPGARWKVVQTQALEGMQIEQTTVAELVRLDGTRAEILYEVTQTARPGEILSAGKPTGLYLQAMAGTGQGTAHLDLRRPMPASLKLDSSVRWEVRDKTRDKLVLMNVSMLTQMRAR